MVQKQFWDQGQYDFDILWQIFLILSKSWQWQWQISKNFEMVTMTWFWFPKIFFSRFSRFSRFCHGCHGCPECHGCHEITVVITEIHYILISKAQYQNDFWLSRNKNDFYDSNFGYFKEQLWDKYITLTICNSQSKDFFQMCDKIASKNEKNQLNFVWMFEWLFNLGLD